THRSSQKVSDQERRHCCGKIGIYALREVKAESLETRRDRSHERTAGEDECERCAHEHRTDPRRMPEARPDRRSGGKKPGRGAADVDRDRVSEAVVEESSHPEPVAGQDRVVQVVVLLHERTGPVGLRARGRRQRAAGIEGEAERDERSERDRRDCRRCQQEPPTEIREHYLVACCGLSASSSESPRNAVASRSTTRIAAGKTYSHQSGPSASERLSVSDAE